MVLSCFLAPTTTSPMVWSLQLSAAAGLADCSASSQVGGSQQLCHHNAHCIRELTARRGVGVKARRDQELFCFCFPVMSLFSLLPTTIEFSHFKKEEFMALVQMFFPPIYSNNFSCSESGEVWVHSSVLCCHATQKMGNLLNWCEMQRISKVMLLKTLFFLWEFFCNLLLWVAFCTILILLYYSYTFVLFLYFHLSLCAACWSHYHLRQSFHAVLMQSLLVSQATEIWGSVLLCLGFFQR